MAIFDLFSRRQRRLRGEFPDVYQYTELPDKFRVQVVHILKDVFGEPEHYGSGTQKWFQAIHDALAREYGQFKLSKNLNYTGDYRAAVFEFFGTTADMEQALDVIELSFRYAIAGRQQNYHHWESSKPKLTPEEGIEELNQRFRENGIGFQFESNQLVRTDSSVLHQEAVRPALHILTAQRFAGANTEFLKAHEHYRHGRHAEAVNECLKALESTLKVICKTQKWPFKETDTAKTLLDVVFEHSLVPSFLQSEFAGLRAVLESGVPTTRSRTSAHGAGSSPKPVPPHLTSYILHLTASSILFLAEAEKYLP